MIPGPHLDSRRQAGPAGIVRRPHSIHVPTNPPAAAARARAGPTTGQPDAPSGRKTIVLPVVQADLIQVAHRRAPIGREKPARAAAFSRQREEPGRQRTGQPQAGRRRTDRRGIGRAPALGSPTIALRRLLTGATSAENGRRVCASMLLNRTRPEPGAPATQHPTAPRSIEPAQDGLPMAVAANRTAPVLLRHDSINRASTRRPSNPASTGPVLNGPDSIDSGSIVPVRAVLAQTGPAQVEPGQVVRAQVVPAQAARFAAREVSRGLSPPVPANRAPAARGPAPSRASRAAAPTAAGLAPQPQEVQLPGREVNRAGSPSRAAQGAGRNASSRCGSARLCFTFK